MRIIFIRHGDPDYSIDGLTEKGAREADLLAPRVARWQVRQFYCSPLGRAKETARRAMAQIDRDIITCDWMQEFLYWVKDVNTGKPRLAWDFLPDEWADDALLADRDRCWDSPRLESPVIRDKYREVCEGLDAILEGYGYRRRGNYYEIVKSCDDTIVFFCHLGATMIMLSHLLNISPILLLQSFSTAPTSVTVVNTEERDGKNAAFRCHLLGDVTHLHDGGEPASASGYFAEIFQL